MTPALSAGTTVVVAKDQVSTTVAGETVILHMENGEYYGLDVVGTRVWALFERPQTIGAVADMLVSEFDVSRDRALADLLDLVADLQRHGLVEVVPAQATG